MKGEILKIGTAKKLADYEKLKKENEMLNHYKLLYQKVKERNDKALKFIQEHNKNAGNLYYKYDGKYLLSEIKEDLMNI